MHHEVRHPRSTSRWLLAALLGLGIGAAAPAQEAIHAPVASPAGAPLTLDDCLQLAMEKQPALAAARASLAAAHDGQQGLANLPIYAKALTRDFPQRKQQACLGVTIA